MAKVFSYLVCGLLVRNGFPQKMPQINQSGGPGSVHPFTTEHTSKCQLAWLLYQIIEYHHLDKYIRCIYIKSFLTSFIVAFFNLLKE